ncbi:MAG: phosphoserine phosphatase SerB [Pseudomonadota bacterium]
MSDSQTQTIVLTAASGSNAITEDVVAQVQSALAGIGPGIDAWLGQGHGWEVQVTASAAEIATHLAMLRAALARHPIDVNAVPADGMRRKRLLIADMDSTIIEQECIDELADVLGLREQVSGITERAMRGELAFEPALRERVALLAGLETTAIDRLLAEQITLTPGARTLVQTMRTHGAFTALVSGGFTLFTGPVAARAGFHIHTSNTLDTADGTLSGTVRAPILGREAKRDALNGFVREQRLAISDTLAVGDGANDLAMIEAAGLGVAFRAKPAVADAADAAITHGDLTALLYLQGYRDDAFVD